MKPNYTLDQLRKTAEALSVASERITAIHGCVQNHAEDGDFLISFNRTEYLYSDFAGLVEAGFTVKPTPTHIHVSLDRYLL